MQQAQRVRDHRRLEHFRARESLAVAGIGIFRAVRGVLDLNGSEVLDRGTVQIHAPARIERKVSRVGDAEVKAHPVRILRPLTRHRCEEPLGRRVRTHHEGNLARPGENLRARRGECLRTGRAGGIGGVDLRALPAERLRESGARHVTRIAATHGGGTGNELHVGPRDARILERGARRVHAVLDKIAPPLAPGMHADAEHCDLAAHARAASGFHFHTSLSVSPSR